MNLPESVSPAVFDIDAFVRWLEFVLQQAPRSAGADDRLEELGVGELEMFELIAQFDELVRIHDAAPLPSICGAATVGREITSR